VRRGAHPIVRCARSVAAPCSLGRERCDAAHAVGFVPPPRAPAMSTLASARPGSTHPLSEAAPPSGHTHSVARNPSPHEETKLSGAKGTTQERLDETLGAGRPPGPARPVADAGRDK
jgi:hypothetical protein